jgi:hypothetical protein
VWCQDICLSFLDRFCSWCSAVYLLYIRMYVIYVSFTTIRAGKTGYSWYSKYIGEIQIAKKINPLRARDNGIPVPTVHLGQQPCPNNSLRVSVKTIRKSPQLSHILRPPPRPPPIRFSPFNRLGFPSSPELEPMDHDSCPLNPPSPRPNPKLLSPHPGSVVVEIIARLVNSGRKIVIGSMLGCASVPRA